MKSTDQFDLLRHSDAAKANAYRVAADTARVDPFWTEEERAKRAAYYEAEANRFDQRISPKEKAI